MKNFHSAGHSLTMISPGVVASGAGVLIGAVFGVANGDAASAAPLVLSVLGAFELPKEAPLVIAAGALVYWDTTAGQVTTVSSGNTKIGVAIKAAGSSATTALVRLSGAF